MLRLRCWAFWTLLCCGLWPAAAQEVERVRLTQVHVRLPQVIAYLDAVDGRGLRAAALDRVTATLGDHRLELEEDPVPFDASGEGIAYIFLVDVSKSLAVEQFGQIQAAMAHWIADLETDDRAAILSFGDDCRTVVDFTADREALNAALATLGPTDQRTRLHKALVRALELGHRQDPGLPSRRVAVVLTDGRDEGSGQNVEDVVRKIGDQPLPIYALGYSQLRPANRQRYLDVLHRFAVLSGGLFVDAGQGSIDDRYVDLRQAIQRVWVAHFRCDACREDGKKYRFQSSVEVAEKAFPVGIDVRLVLSSSPPPKTPVDPPPKTQPELPTAEGSLAWWLAAAGAALLLVLILWWWSRRRRGAELPAAADSERLDLHLRAEGKEDDAREDAEPPPRDEPELPPNPGTEIQLVVIRGRKPGRTYRARVAGRCTAGAGDSNDIVLAQEDGVETHHFELVREAEELWIRPQNQRSTTSVNGVPTADRHQLEPDDLILAGSTELRIIFEEP